MQGRAIPILVCILAASSWESPSFNGQARGGPPQASRDEPTATDRDYLWRIGDEQNERLMRKHAWEKLIAITKEKSGRATWESWPQSQEVFAKDQPEECEVAVDKSSFLAFHAPTQLSLHKNFVQGPKLVQTVHFSPSARRHVCQKRYYKHEVLSDLRDKKDAWRFIEPFPHESVVIKAVWWPVTKGRSPMPVWDGAQQQQALPPDDRYPYSAWSRLVAVDWGGSNRQSVFMPAPEWWDHAEGGEETEFTLIPLNEFYVHAINENDLADEDTKNLLADLYRVFYKKECKIDEDAMVLVGLHVATKELSDWVWMTFWWHDRSKEGEFSRGRPEDMESPWSGFLMDVTFSATTPREPDGSPKRIFNPWLEGGMRGGTRSNCLTCHQRAAWDSRGNEKVVAEYPLAPDHEIFRKWLRLDYLWSILHEVNKQP